MTCIMFLGVFAISVHRIFMSVLHELSHVQQRHFRAAPLVGMSLCLPLAYYQQTQAGKAKRSMTDAEQPLMNGGEVRRKHSHLRGDFKATNNAVLRISNFLKARPLQSNSHETCNAKP